MGKTQQNFRIRNLERHATTLANQSDLNSIENQSKGSVNSLKGRAPISKIGARPRSSNSHGQVLQHQNTSNTTSNLDDQSDLQADFDDQDSLLEIQQNETLQIPLTDSLFKNLSWASSFDYVNHPQKARQILGLNPVRSNLVWRYFLSLLKQRSSIKQLREKRVGELKVLVEKLFLMNQREGIEMKQRQI